MQSIKSFDFFLQPGYIYLPAGPRTIALVVAGGVAVSIYDPIKKIGGICHFVEPKAKKSIRPNSNYGNYAITTLISFFKKTGSSPRNLMAHVVGGSVCKSLEKSYASINSLGNRNYLQAMKVLIKNKIINISSDVGGHQGRKILYNSFTNEILTLKTNTIRKSDWINKANECSYSNS